jgi:anti-sigma factor RsiW
MKLTSAELKMLYQVQPSRAELNRADCLADEFLARACTGNISTEDRLFVADHLTTCRDCAEEYQIARAVKTWVDESSEVATANRVGISSKSATTTTLPKWWQ